MALESPNPDGMEFDEWARWTASLSNAAPYVEMPPDESRWQQWGAMLAISPPFSTLALPDPFTFADWRAWAQGVGRALTAAN